MPFLNIKMVVANHAGFWWILSLVNIYFWGVKWLSQAAQAVSNKCTLFSDNLSCPASEVGFVIHEKEMGKCLFTMAREFKKNCCFFFLLNWTTKSQKLNRFAFSPPFPPFFPSRGQRSYYFSVTGQRTLFFSVSWTAECLLTFLPLLQASTFRPLPLQGFKMRRYQPQWIPQWGDAWEMSEHLHRYSAQLFSITHLLFHGHPVIDTKQDPPFLD